MSRHSRVGALAALIALGAASFVAVTIVHEAAHYTAALAVGVPGTCLRFVMAGINPGMENVCGMPEGWRQPVISYAGGLTASIAAAAAWLWTFSRVRTGPTAFGLVVRCLAGYWAIQQVGIGLAKGWMHDDYVAGTGAAQIVGLTAGVVGTIVPAWVLWRILGRTSILSTFRVPHEGTIPRYGSAKLHAASRCASLIRQRWAAINHEYRDEAPQVKCPGRAWQRCAACRESTAPELPRAVRIQHADLDLLL